MFHDALQATRVSLIGFVGTFAGITLEQWSFVASITVSALTAIYMSVKLVLLLHGFLSKKGK